MNPARTEFARIAAREPIPLAHGALLIAKEEYPDLDVAHYLEHLAALGRAARKRAARGREHGRARADALRLPVRADRLCRQSRQLRRPAQLFSQRRAGAPPRHPDHALGDLPRGRPARRAQPLRRLLSFALPGQGGRRARRTDHRSVQRRRDPRPRRHPHPPQADLRPAGRVAAGDAEGGGRTAYPRAHAAQFEKHLRERRRLAALARRAGSHPDSRAARARRYAGARRALRAAGMFRRRARRLSRAFSRQYANHPAADAAREAVVRLTRQVARIN